MNVKYQRKPVQIFLQYLEKGDKQPHFFFKYQQYNSENRSSMDQFH